MDRRSTVASKLSAVLVCIMASLFPNWASAHDALQNPSIPRFFKHDLMPLLDGHEQLRDELLPIVHECHQVSVIIRAKDMTEDKLTRACILLKETEDYFHATMQTDLGSPLRGVELEILAFGGFDDMNEYWRAVYSDGIDAEFTGTYLFRQLSWTTAVVLLSRSAWGIWEHEYVHHLDWTFNQTVYCDVPGGSGYLTLGPFEALAEYVTDRDYGASISVIGDGSNLPTLLGAWRYWEHDDQALFQYGWGYVIVRFLFEEHPEVILALYDFIRGLDVRGDDCWSYPYFSDFQSYAAEVLPPLTEDFHEWARSFANLSRVRQIEPVTLFLDDDGKRVWSDYPDTYGHVVWRRYFHTSLQDLSVSMSFSVPYRLEQLDSGPYYVTDVVGVSPRTKFDWIFHARGIGTAEVTATLTAPDGETARQTFTVNVARDLHWQLNPVVVRDPVSTEEGLSFVDLSPYFTGPALEESELSAESHDPGIALVEVRGGRLAITAVSVGEVAITVRGNYHGRVAEQTFTVAITDECPAWLCRSALSGWRSTLLQEDAAQSVEGQQ